MIFNLRKPLSALISGRYTRKDVHIVVKTFSDEARRILILKEAGGWSVRNFLRAGNSEMDQIAVDFIAPLFARNTEGVFVVLRDQLGEALNQSDKQFFTWFQRLVYAHTQQEFIRLFQERDPVGKILHRSLHYILNKHPQWGKVRSEDHQTIITLSGHQLSPAPQTEIILKLSHTQPGKKSLTGMMEKYLEHALNIEKHTVSLYQLFQACRTLVQQDIEWLNTDHETVDPVIELTVSQRISETLQLVNSTLLSKYVSKNKLTHTEQEIFQAALFDILVDHADGGVVHTYAAYLNQHATFEISDSFYRDQYKKQFEYVAKTAKQDFSARIKSDYKL